MESIAKYLQAGLVIGLSIGGLRAAPTYPIVATGQTKSYDNRREIAPPKPGQPFYGQDAQHQINAASDTVSPDGLTVRDNVTGLTWQRGPDTDGDGTLTARDKPAPGPRAAGNPRAVPVATISLSMSTVPARSVAIPSLAIRHSFRAAVVPKEMSSASTTSFASSAAASLTAAFTSVA